MGSEVQPSRFQLSWETPSYSNILEQSLSYKQVKDKNSPELLTYGENELKIPNMQKKNLNCTGRIGPDKQKFNFLLDKLEPGTRYQATIASRNSHGWGPSSLPITFKTSHFSGVYSGQPPGEPDLASELRPPPLHQHLPLLHDHLGHSLLLRLLPQLCDELAIIVEVYRYASKESIIFPPVMKHWLCLNI